MRLRLGIITMLVFAKVFSGLAEETNSPAVIEDLFAAPLPAVTNAPPKLLPAFDVHTYRIEGNTILPPQEFGMLSNYTGKVDVRARARRLGQVAIALPRFGYPNINVTLPEQKFTNGLVRVKIVETGADKCGIRSWPPPSPIYSSRPKAENRRLKCAAITSKATRRCRRRI